MKRFHVHMHVDDLGKNIDFYSKLFGSAPSRIESDYAKWMLDDPRVNFAISTRGSQATGLDHLGFQVDAAEELTELKERAQAADMALLDEGEATCCYARSEKHCRSCSVQECPQTDCAARPGMSLRALMRLKWT